MKNNEKAIIPAVRMAYKCGKIVTGMCLEYYDDYHTQLRLIHDNTDSCNLVREVLGFVTDKGKFINMNYAQLMGAELASEPNLPNPPPVDKAQPEHLEPASDTTTPVEMFITKRCNQHNEVHDWLRPRDKQGVMSLGEVVAVIDWLDDVGYNIQQEFLTYPVKICDKCHDGGS